MSMSSPAVAAATATAAAAADLHVSASVDQQAACAHTHPVRACPTENCTACMRLSGQASSACKSHIQEVSNQVQFKALT